MHALKKAPALAALACMAATGLMAVPGAADAASRNFQVRNESSERFVLHNINRVACASSDRYCHGHLRGAYPAEFEGRPEIGSGLAPGKRDEFELKYSFEATGAYVNYAADLEYGAFTVRITTTNYSNSSECFVHQRPEAEVRCIADGDVIRILDGKR
jgi:hypothetical protein